MRSARAAAARRRATRGRRTRGCRRPPPPAPASRQSGRSRSRSNRCRRPAPATRRRVRAAARTPRFRGADRTAAARAWRRPTPGAAPQLSAASTLRRAMRSRVARQLGRQVAGELLEQLGVQLELVPPRVAVDADHAGELRRRELHALPVEIGVARADAERRARCRRRGLRRGRASTPARACSRRSRARRTCRRRPCGTS